MSIYALLEGGRPTLMGLNESSNGAKICDIYSISFPYDLIDLSRW